MEYIARFSDPTELSRIRHLLRSKGIPTHEQTLEGRKMGWYAALYVCMPEHVEDALKIIRNPNHEPANPVDAEAFEKAIADSNMALLVKLVTIWGLITFIVFSVVMYLLWRYG